ncbi:hypothetical protein AK830_g1193 [Neonectria ditissima]|uniref:FAD dependent oxidoreductase domain-containing protein n=1 Tax=Neonectria ditissima TaxID=78410 RepID=A0A0N8H8S5_9HYPO|nr:hypothetical protein AK830_g1193 [Neonectria ditissima]
MASTVILGSGIIGVSTAYYLSQHQPGSTIHLVDSSPELFASASGYAGGFLARDWFPASLVPLAELSYELHKTLADKEGGREKWSYAKSVTVSYDPKGERTDGKRGEDWLLAGTSRAGLVQDRKREIKHDEIPPWLKRLDGDAVSLVDDGEGTAVLDPLKLCEFLLAKCQTAGVNLHYPATPISVGTNTHGELASLRIACSNSLTETDIPATRLLIASGSWSPQVLASLFKTSRVKIPIQSLAGHSIVFKNPGEVGDTSHSLYCSLDDYAPEIYFRPNGDIYVAGLNSSTISLPKLAVGSVQLEDHLDELKKTAKWLIHSDKELQVVRTGLCFRPVTPRGIPYITRLSDKDLGHGIRTKPGHEGGVFVAAGHGPWGISLSLGSGMVMAEMMQGREVSADVSTLGWQELVPKL